MKEYLMILCRLQFGCMTGRKKSQIPTTVKYITHYYCAVQAVFVEFILSNATRTTDSLVATDQYDDTENN